MTKLILEDNGCGRVEFTLPIGIQQQVRKQDNGYWSLLRDTLSVLRTALVAAACHPSGGREQLRMLRDEVHLLTHRFTEPPAGNGPGKIHTS